MIVVTGATGQLGQLVVEGLVRRVPAADIAAAVRNPEKAAGLAALGVQIRTADYNAPESLATAFAGSNQLLLISSSAVGQRVAQHAAAIDAARQAGVGHLVYTSLLHADTSTLGLAPEHLATEQAVRDSGLPFTLLRNGWYTENYTKTVLLAADTGSFACNAGDGAISSAARADYAEAAVAVLTGEGHQGRVYELAGDVAWTYPELAAELSRATGRAIAFRDVSAASHRQILANAGLPAAFADAIVDYDRGIAEGDLLDSSGELRTLIGRPTTPLADTVAAILKN